MKKKLVITSDCFLPRWDGIARFLSQLIPQLRNEYEITCIVPEFEGEIKIQGVNIIRIPLLKIRFGDIFFSRFQYRKIKEIISKHDLIFNQTIGPIGMCSIIAASRLKKPVISYVHSIEWELASKSIKRFRRLISFLIKLIARRLYNKCNVLMVPSHDVEDLLYVNKVKSKKVVVKLGINTDLFAPDILKRSIRKQLEFDSRSFIIGFCGRIGREKDIPTLYKAFKILKKRYNNLKLLIVGSGIQKEIPDALRAKDQVRLTTLRGTLAAFTNEAVAKGKTPQDKLTDDEAIAVIRRLVKQRKDSIEQFEKGQRQDLADNEKLEMKVLEEFLPAQMSEEKIREIVLKKKEELNPTKEKLGIFMGAVMKDLRAGQADGAMVKRIVEELL